MKETPDIDKVDPENLVELYSLLGLHDTEGHKGVSMMELEKEYSGNLESAVLHLVDRGHLDIDYTSRRVRLPIEKRENARNLVYQVYWGNKSANQSIEEILEKGNAPDYLLDPDTSEEFREPGDALGQSPDEEFYTRIIEILSGGRELKPVEVEEELAVDINFDIEPKLAYLETQGAVLRTENNRYRLQTENIDDRFFGENINVEGVLAERNRYGEDPWKP